MTENFRHLVDGVRELRLQVKQGDLKVTIAAGQEPTLEWDSHGDEAPEVARDGDVLRIKQVDSWFGRRMDLEVRLAASPEVVMAKTGNGEVELSGAVGAVRVESGNGQLTIADVVGAVEANTGNGEVQLQLVGPTELRVSSGNGDIKVWGGSVLETRLNTGKGDLECLAALEAGQHSFGTGKGNISALLPPDANARVDLQTGHGDVISDFALVRVGRSGPMGFGGSRMVGSIGDGEPEIQVAAKTGKGDLRLLSTAGPRAGTGRERVSVGFDERRAWREQRRVWRDARRGGWGDLGVDLAATISAEVASAVASSVSGWADPPRSPEPPPAPRVEVLHETSASSAASAAADQPAAPPPPPLDMTGAVRSTQTPTGPTGEDATLAVLQAVARGEITPDEAELLLAADRRRGGPV